MTATTEPLTKWDWLCMGFWLGVPVGMLLGFALLFLLGSPQ